MERLSIRLLGAFEVVVDGEVVPEDAWRPRRGADLVKLLALSDGHRLHRERAVDALWPRLAPEAGLANLRKAAHLARRAIGDKRSVVLQAGIVMLASPLRGPGRAPVTNVTASSGHSALPRRGSRTYRRSTTNLLSGCGHDISQARDRADRHGGPRGGGPDRGRIADRP